MVLIILILPMLVLLFLFFLSHVPEIIKPASFKSTLSCFNLFLYSFILFALLILTSRPSTNKVVENDQNLDVEGVNDESSFYDSVDWLMRDEEIDASGNSDDQRTPIPPMLWIHVNSCKLDPQVSDATTKITSSDDHRIKRKRRQYRPKVKNIRHATPIPPAPPLPRAPSLAQAPAPDDKIKADVLGGNLKWELPTVNRQPSTWECGYYIMRWMHDFVLKYQNDDFRNTVVDYNYFCKIIGSEITDIQVVSNGFLSCGADGTVKLNPSAGIRNTKMQPNQTVATPMQVDQWVQMSRDDHMLSLSALDVQRARDTIDWLMRDEEIDASGNSNDQRTPIPPMPWIHVNSCKLDPQVSDATAKITSSDDHRIKRKRRQYRPKVKNIRHATPIPPAPPLPRAPSLAQAPAPVQGKNSIFQIMFKKPRKATHIPFVTTTVPPPPPPPPSWSLFSNCFTSRNKIKNIPSSKNSKLPPLPPTGPPPQPEPQRQRYLQPMGQQSTFIKGEIINYIEQGKGKVTAEEPTNKKKALEEPTKAKMALAKIAEQTKAKERDEKTKAEYGKKLNELKHAITLHRPKSVLDGYNRWMSRGKDCVEPYNLRVDKEVFRQAEDSYFAINPTDIIELLTNKKLELGILTCFEMSLYQLKGRSQQNKVGFLHPEMITPDVYGADKGVTLDYLARALEGYEFYVTPYLQGAHYVLFIICPKHGRGFILDSQKESVFHTEDNYRLAGLVDSVLGGRLKWELPTIPWGEESGKSLPRTQPTQNPACMVLVKRPAEGAGSASFFFFTGSEMETSSLVNSKNSKLVLSQGADVDIQVVSNGFLSCGADGTVKLVQLRDLLWASPWLFSYLPIFKPLSCSFFTYCTYVQKEYRPMCFLTLLHAPWYVPWRPAVTGMTVEERRGKSAAIASHGSLPCPLYDWTCVGYWRTRFDIGHLPHLQKSRTNLAVGVREDFTNHFKMYVAGGMSEAANGGAASYEPTLEVFNSKSNKWMVMGSIPVEFAVRLTVWTPNENVYKELGVPMGDTLEFATLVPCDGKVAVVGGTHDGNVLVWELGDGDEWILIERMPLELAKRFAGSSTKCAGIEGGVCLYKDIDSAMVVWRRVKNHKNKWEWCSIDGCNTVGSSTLPNDWKGIIDALVKLNNDNAIRSILRNERNKRLFDKESRNVETITRLIIKYVKLKLISLKVKQSVQVRKVARELEICCGCILSHAKPALLTQVLIVNKIVEEANKRIQPPTGTVELFGNLRAKLYD
ncbi:ulp1 protease family, C-terminal catalytic domain-containing protein [Tanacetum coccineum]